MATFDASAIVDDLRFDLTKYRPPVPDPEHPDFDRLKQLHDEEWTGTIPEPSDAAIERLFNRDLPGVQNLGRDLLEDFLAKQREDRRAWFAANRPGDAAELDGDALDGLDVPTDYARAERDDYTAMSEDLRAKAREATMDALATFCDGHPSRAVLEVLPWRAMQHFLGWVTGQFRPEALAAAMTS